AVDEEAPAAEDVVLAPDPAHRRDEAKEILVAVPIDLADRVVLAVRVVVAALAAPELVSGDEQRNALGEQQAGEQVAALPSAQLEHRGVVGGPLDAAVPAAVVVAAVAVVLAVGLVVLGVVADQVGEGEAVVDGDEV